MRARPAIPHSSYPGPVPIAHCVNGMTPPSDSSALRSIDDMLEAMVGRGASDLHLTVGTPPAIRVRGEASRNDCTSLNSSMSSTRTASAAETESNFASSDNCILPRPVASHSKVTPATIATERR